MEAKSIAEAVVRDGVLKLDSLREAIERYAKEAGEVVERCKRELETVQQACDVGASKTFLGASVMLIGFSEYPLGAPEFQCREGRRIELSVDSHNPSFRLHGDPEALAAMRGRYKAIVLFYKAD